MPKTPSRKPIRIKKETWDLLHFLAEKSKEATSPLNVVKLSRDFVKISGTSRTVHAVKLQMYSIRSQLWDFDEFDTETKVKMIFGLSASVNKEYLTELRKCACVEVDDKQRITKYSANNGSLELEGSHTYKEKARASWEEKRKHSELLNYSSNGEEVEQDEESKEVKALNGRVSEFDGNSNSYNENEATKDVSMEEQMQTCEAKERKVATTSIQNDSKKRKTDSQCVIYNDSGEEITTHNFVKQEPDDEQSENRIPASHRFSDKTDDFQSNDVGIAPDDVNSADSQESEEMINVTEFLKLIRLLVRALESPILNGIHDKINRKMKHFEDLDQKVSISVILLALQSMLHLSLKHTALDLPTDESTVLKDFLLILRTVTFSLNSPEIVAFHRTIKKASNKIEDQKKKVAFARIRSGLEYALEIVLP